MNPPKIEPGAKTTNPTTAQAIQAPVSPPAPQEPKAKLKPVTIQLSAEVHQKLRIVAVSKGATTSALCESYIDAALKKDILLAVAKLSE